jgi:uncharacterized YigZ family protein
MRTVKEVFTETLEVNKSKFIAYLVPYEKYEEVLNELKNNHPKARHFVTAFRYYNEYKQVVEGSSDDGEPRGSSGRPTLNVLEGNRLINVAVITVRYFGGILLGVGGLVRAYSDSANLVIQKSDLIDYIEYITVEFQTDYSNASKYEYLFKKHNLDVIDRSFLDGITYKIRADFQSIEDFKNEI